MKKMHSIIAALDIGSSKASIVVAGVHNSKTDLDKAAIETLEIIGVGNAQNFGVKQGLVVNIETTAEAIRKAREEAELMSGYRLEEVWMTVSGAHIKSFDSKGMVAIKNREVNQQDVERVIEAGKAVAVPQDRSVVHVLPREYKVDSQDGIIDPVGMSGIRLEANIHIVTASQAALQNNFRAIEKAGLRVAGVILEPLGAAVSTLSQDEKSLGVCVVDVGAGSCKSVYYVNGSVALTSFISVGGNHFTHDVALGLRTPQSSAEVLKKKYGCALSSLITEDETIEVEGVGGRKSRTLLKKDLSEVLEPRAEEVLQMIQNDIKSSGLMPLLGSGVVFTGGASQLDGFIEMAEFIFDLPVRRGSPADSFDRIGGLTDVVKSSAFSASVGALLYAFAKGQFTKASLVREEVSQAKLKIKSFFENMF